MRTRLQRFVFGVAVTVAYLYCFPYFPKIRSANELPRIYLTQAMVEERTVAIDSGVERWGATADVSPSGGHLYSNKAPGSSFLAIPSYLALRGAKALTDQEPSLAEMTWTFRVTTGVLPTLLFLTLLWRFLGRFAAYPHTRRLVLVAYALGTMALTYSILFISHQLAAICIATAYILAVWVTEEGLSPRWLIACGFAAGCAPLVDYQAAFAGVPVAAYLVWHSLFKRAAPLRFVFGAILGAAVPIAVLLLYHNAAFGDPFRTGYDASQTFAHFHQQGFLGMDGFRMEAFTGSMVAPDNGLLFFCPALLLAIPGWYLLAKKGEWWHVGITLSVAILYVIFISSLSFWRGGWQLGPRYITAMLPFLLVPMAVTLAWCETRWLARSIAVGLIGVGVLVYSLSAAIFPHFPEVFANPLYEVVFALVADGYVAYNGGWLLGIHGVASLLPYLGIVLGLFLWVSRPPQGAWRSTAVSVAITAAIVLSYGFAPDGGQPAREAYKRIETVMPEYHKH